jgi:hypothetical protein
LDELEIEQQIIQGGSKICAITTIVNYGLYQPSSTTDDTTGGATSGASDDTTDGQQIEQQTDTKNKGLKGSKVIKGLKRKESKTLPAVPTGPDPKEINRATWEAYSQAYRRRYSIDPIRNAKVNGIIAKFTKRVPQLDAADVAAFYVGHNGRLYVQSKHCLDLLIRDAEKIYSDWATNRQTTETDARQKDETANRGNVWNAIIEKRTNRGEDGSNAS